jgi:membrane associated rhomboid family serine protease
VSAQRDSTRAFIQQCPAFIHGLIKELATFFPMQFSRTPSGWYELDGASRPGPGLKALMIAMVVVFAFQGPLHLESFAMLRSDQVWHGHIYQLFTYGWLHADLLHLLFNLLGMWIFGSQLERVWGSTSLTFFFISGIVGAGLTHVLLDPFFSGNQAPVIGASGGVYGLLAAYGILFRQRKLLLLGILPIRAGTLALLFGLFALWEGISQSQDGIAHFAHLGGMLTGLFLLYGPDLGRSTRLWRHRLRMQAYARKHAGPASSQQDAPGDRSYRSGTSSERARISQQVDELLEKISREGSASLSPEEKRFLDVASAYLRNTREGSEL